MNKKLIFGMFVLILLVGCVNPYQTKINENQLKINSYLIDNANIDRLNECTRLGSCDGYKCLCDTYPSEENKKVYCERYEKLCVNKICDEIIKNVNGVNFMEEHFGDDRYAGCIFVYPKVVELININNFNNDTLTCLSNYRNNQNVPDEDISSYEYHNDRWYNEEGNLIKC